MGRRSPAAPARRWQTAQPRSKGGHCGFGDTQPIAGGQIADARGLQLGSWPLRRYGCAAAGRILPTPLFAGRLAERSIGWGS